MNENKKMSVLLYAYTALNLGDDLFVKIICERYPDVDFYIECEHKFAKPFKLIKNLVVIPKRENFNRIARRLNLPFRVPSIIDSKNSDKFDLIVQIGGSIFIQTPYWKETLNIYKGRLRKGIPYYIIGSNFGPYENQEFYDEFKEIFKQLSGIVFRDKYSYQEFSSIKTVHYASDVIFNLSTEANISSQKSPDTKVAIISVIDLSQRKELREFENFYIQKHASLVDSLISYGYKVVLMSFCKYQKDLECINRICSLLSDKSKEFVSVYSYEGDTTEAVSLINDSNVMIGARFHSVILSLLLRKKVLPIIYSSKTSNYLSDIGFEGETWNIKELEHFDKTSLDRFLESDYLFSPTEEIAKANSQFTQLDYVLNSKVN